MLLTSRLSGGKARRSGPRTAGLRPHRLVLEMLEDRRLLSIGAWDDDHLALTADANSPAVLAVDVNDVAQSRASSVDAPRFAPEEILVGFEGDVVAAYRGNPNTIVYIRADENGLNKHLYAVIDRCQRNGITRFSLRTEPPGRIP